MQHVDLISWFPVCKCMTVIYILQSRHLLQKIKCTNVSCADSCLYMFIFISILYCKVMRFFFFFFFFQSAKNLSSKFLGRYKTILPNSLVVTYRVNMKEYFKQIWVNATFRTRNETFYYQTKLNLMYKLLISVGNQRYPKLVFEFYQPNLPKVNQATFEHSCASRILSIIKLQQIKSML